MAFVVAATWRANDGQEDTVRQAIEAMTEPSRQESGCLAYQGHRSTDDPREFFLYERYANAAAFDAHRATPHFERYVRGQAFPNLAAREVSTYETLE